MLANGVCRRSPDRSIPARAQSGLLHLSGSQPFAQQEGVYMMIGERTNVAGSPRFAKPVKEGKYEENSLPGTTEEEAPLSRIVSRFGGVQV